MSSQCRKVKQALYCAKTPTAKEIYSLAGMAKYNNVSTAARYGYCLLNIFFLLLTMTLKKIIFATTTNHWCS